MALEAGDRKTSQTGPGERTPKGARTSGCAVCVGGHGAAGIKVRGLQIGYRDTVPKEKASQDDQKQEDLIMPMDTSVQPL